jgi:hypothetical protein
MQCLASVERLRGLTEVLALRGADEEMVRQRDERRAVVGGEAASIEEHRRRVLVVAKREARSVDVDTPPPGRRLGELKGDCPAPEDVSFERRARRPATSERGT